ncbi:MAG: protein-export membrane protein SecF [Chloroflexi bacterium RBG_16_50_9]|nr:MAG: protein-export membrane protein SecF [Chloroflexi bacterium RBG_16_50_9]
MKFDIIGNRLWFFVISGLLVLISIIALASVGLKAGIEFSSGSILGVNFEEHVEYAEFRQEITNLGYGNAIIQRTGQGEFLIRTQELTGEEKTYIETSLADRFGKLSETQFYSVSPMVASETARNAAIAVAVAMIGILLYVTFAFRHMPNPFRYGTCAIIALLHDALVALGVFSILGAILDWQINLMFIIGVLAVIGYSINNTIVIFDRIRENTRLGVSPDFEVVVNNSLVETLGRSLNTSITTLITLLALLLFVGATIQNFVVVLLIGIVAGTFDSICVAPSLLVVWNKRG